MFTSRHTTSLIRTSGLHRRVHRGRCLCCMLSTPRLASTRCSDLVTQLHRLRTHCPSDVPTSSPARHINNHTSSRFARIHRLRPLLDLNGIFSTRRLHTFSRHIRDNLPTNDGIRCIVRPGVSNLTYDLVCRGNGLIHTTAHNSNMMNRGIATGIHAVHDVPLALGIPRNRTIPRLLSIHNRICVPHRTFVHLGRRHTRHNRDRFTGPHGTTTNDLHRLSPRIATDHDLDFFTCCLMNRKTRPGRDRSLTLLTHCNFGIDRGCGIIRGVSRTVGCVNSFGRLHRNLSCSASNTIVGIGSICRRHVLNTANGSPH